jgi:hypothetical protein
MSNATETRDYPEHGRRNPGHASTARAASRRASSDSEASRDQEEKDRGEETSVNTVLRSHEVHPSCHCETEVDQAGAPGERFGGS